jgi:hypothetical protein
VRVLLVLLASAAYLGLGVLGWGGFAAFFSHAALIALAIATFALAGAAYDDYCGRTSRLVPGLY